MRCLKCGSELETEQAFCEVCRLEMEKYPVNPNVVVQLPTRKDPPPPRKTHKRRSLSPEEQIVKLKKRIWFLCGILAVTIALLAAMVYPTVTFFIRNYNLRPGQNYTTIAPSTTAATEPTETLDPFAGMAE